MAQLGISHHVLFLIVGWQPCFQTQSFTDLGLYLRYSWRFRRRGEYVRGGEVFAHGRPKAIDGSLDGQKLSFQYVATFIQTLTFSHMDRYQ
jgi:hypothetical protein